MQKRMLRKEYSAAFLLFSVSLFCILLPSSLLAEDNWITQARLNVPEPGIIETILPPGLHFDTGRDIAVTEIELELLGPDKKSRSFELYFRENQGPTQVALKTGKVELLKDSGYIWEGTAPENFIADRMRVEMADTKFVGKVDIEALYDTGPDEYQWTWLKKNAALFKIGGYRHADVDIEPGIYKGFRLHFTGYDIQYGETPLPVSSVTLFGKYIRKDFAEVDITPDFRETIKNGYIEVETILPGSGLWVNRVELKTDAQFQGEWRLGEETVVYGERKFVDLIKGVKSTVDKNRQILNIDVNRKWQDRSMVLRLYTGGRHIGRALRFTVRCRLPRLVFLADQEGTYTAMSGIGAKVRILNTPGDPDRNIDQEAMFSPVERNTRFRPEGLVEKYNIKGGPFSHEGYTWTSLVNIPEPGYYKLVLSQRAALEPNQAGIRLIKDDVQVPYFRGAVYQKSIIPDVTMDYNKETNETEWLITLPQVSPHWSSIQLDAEGIFDREVIFQKHGHKGMGWENWATRTWKNQQNEVSHLTLSMSHFPANQTQLRIIINHKDNSPLALNQIQVFYPAPTLYFIAGDSGTYQVTGGNHNAHWPTYDLALVQSRLLESEPIPAKMDEITGFTSNNWKSYLNTVFSDQGWGLYIVLGIVTLVLIFLIAKLFPKSDDG